MGIDPTRIGAIVGEAYMRGFTHGLRDSNKNFADLWELQANIMRGVTEYIQEEI